MSETGAMCHELGVPILSRVDMYATKLLANADRGMDKSTLSRDIIDLAMMIDCWGEIPEESWKKVRAAYGLLADKAFQKTSQMICDRQYLLSCLTRMQMDERLADRIPAILNRAYGAI